MDQLRRETQPPAGTPPSPVPQYWNPDKQQYERVMGSNGAPRADISDRPGRQLGVVTLSGQIVEIDSVTYEIDPPRTIYGLAAQRPSASAAHAVIPWAYYVAVDTGTVTQTDGTDWMDVL